MATTDMTTEQAQAIVERYAATEIAVEREYQERRLAAWNAMVSSTERGPRSPSAQAYRGLIIEQGQAFKDRVADIYEDYPRAYALVAEQKSAAARARSADMIEMAERISYGDGR